MLNNPKHFTDYVYEDNGRCQIHPLSSEGLESYLSPNNYNYRFLKCKHDPALEQMAREEFLKELKEGPTGQKKKQEEVNQKPEVQQEPKQVAPIEQNLHQEPEPHKIIDTQTIKQQQQNENEVNNLNTQKFV